MPKILLSDKQLPVIPSDEVLNEILRMTANATPGKRLLKQLGDESVMARFHLVTEMGENPLGKADAELAATLNPELVRGLLYKIALLEDARTEACNLLQDALGKDISPQKAAKLKKLMEAGNAP